MLARFMKRAREAILPAGRVMPRLRPPGRTGRLQPSPSAPGGTPSPSCNSPTRLGATLARALARVRRTAGSGDAPAILGAACGRGLAVAFLLALVMLVPRQAQAQGTILDDNSLLGDFKVTVGLEKVQRRPRDFHSHVRNYYVLVESDTSVVNLQAEAASARSTVGFLMPARLRPPETGEVLKVTKTRKHSMSARLSLPKGRSKWSVIVTAEDGTSRIYTYFIDRGGPWKVTVKPDVAGMVTITPPGIIPGTLYYGTEGSYLASVPPNTTQVEVSVEAPERIYPYAKASIRMYSGGLPDEPTTTDTPLPATIVLGDPPNSVSIIVDTGAHEFSEVLIIERRASASMATVAEPLTVDFEDLPEGHDGSSAFTARLAFSDEVDISAADMRTALTAIGATVTDAQPVDGSTALWDITITPAGNANVQLLLSPTSDCEATGALCTNDGRMLSAGLGASVPFVAQTAQQGTVAPLTVTLEDLPESHDGSSAFTARLTFSDEVALDEAGLRAALLVSNGSVTGVSSVSADLWDITITPTGNANVQLLLSPTSDCATTGAICTDDGRMLSAGLGASVPFVAQTAEPLTASFSAVPAEHDGSSLFTVGLAFSEEVKAGGRKVKAALTVTGGTVKKARRVAPPSNEQWTITIKPDGHGAVSVLLPATSDCDATGAICTDDGRKLSAGVAVQVAGPPGLSVADAQVQEGPNATLDFVVTLSPMASETVTVGYMTDNGTATAGEDYTAASGLLTFAAGETEKTVTVAVLDDSQDEGSETLNLVLMNASGAYLADGEATGTILIRHLD